MLVVEHHEARHAGPAASLKVQHIVLYVIAASAVDVLRGDEVTIVTKSGGDEFALGHRVQVNLYLLCVGFVGPVCLHLVASSLL